MQQSPSGKANMSYVTEEIPHILYNPKVHHRFLQEPSTYPYPEPF
jgi:hypothetical protein